MDNITKPSEEFNDCSSQIIGCAMRVFAALGNSFEEAVYQKAMEIELKAEGLSFQGETEMPVFYRGEQIGVRKLNLCVENEIMVVIKVIAEIDQIQFMQAVHQLVAFSIKTGLLFNFGEKSLNFKRLYNKNLK